MEGLSVENVGDGILFTKSTRAHHHLHHSAFSASGEVFINRAAIMVSYIAGMTEYKFRYDFLLGQNASARTCNETKPRGVLDWRTTLARTYATNKATTA